MRLEQELAETAIGGVFGGRGFLVRRLCSVLVECPLPHPWIEDVLLQAMGAPSNAQYGRCEGHTCGRACRGCFPFQYRRLRCPRPFGTMGGIV